MTPTPPVPVTLSPILDADVDRVAAFLHEHLNARVPAAAWAAAIGTGWPQADAPNHGFQLRVGDEVVGVNLAFYSVREQGAADAPVRVCNVAALCVLEEHRAHSVRLIRALLKQPGYTFTDLSPSGNVVAIDERLGFTHLDTATHVALNTPFGPRAGVRVLSEPAAIEAALSGPELAIYRDHRSCAAARHVVLVADGRACYLIFRIDRRKRLRLFANLLHVSDPELYVRHGAAVGRHLLLAHRAPLLLVESRLLAGHRFTQRHADTAGRPKLFKSRTLGADQIDYLYSELTCVAW